MSRPSLYLALCLLTAGALAATAAITPAAAGGCCACAASCISYGPVQDVGVQSYEVQSWAPPIQRYVVPQGPDYSGNFLAGFATIDAEAAPLDYPYVGFYSYPVRRGFRPYGGSYRVYPRRAGLLERHDLRRLR